MLRRLLILAVLLLGSALAQTPDNPEGLESQIPSGESQVVTESVTSGATATLTCQVAAPNWAGLCFVEKPLYALGGFAVTLGVEARAAYSQGLDGHLAGYVTLSYNARGWFAWIDVRTPKLAPAIGTSEALRFGISVQIGGR